MSENKNKETQNRLTFNKKGHGGPGGPAGRFMRKKEKPKNTKATIKRLLSYVASSKYLFVALLFIVVFYTLANLYTNILIKDVVGALGVYDVDANSFTILPDKDKFFVSLLTLLITYIIYSVLQYFSSLIGVYISNKTVRKMRTDLFDKIVYLPISYLDSHLYGDIMSRMTNDVDSVSNAVSSSITSLVSGGLTILGCLGIMIWYSPLLTCVSLLVLVLTLLFTRFMSKHVGPLFKKQQAILGKLNTQTEEMVTGYKTVLTNNHQNQALKEFDEYSDEFTTTAIKAQVLAGAMGPIMNFIGNVGYFLVCICGALFIVNGIGGTLLGEALTIPIVIMFLTTTKQFTRPINEIANIYTSLITALACAERIFTILDEKVENFEGEEEFNVDDVIGRIDFENVNFSYVKDTPIIKNLNLYIKPGHKIAFVGATGSGKTTIVNLLLRFYDVDSGIIKIDGKDISKISKRKLRDSISIVLQDPVLFGDTIENNIKYGRDNASEEEIEEALKFANCNSFIRKLPEGKKTVLTEGASNISQGQRQLLTIARAVLANPKILILDEATSSVDTRTEKKIQDAMVRLMANRTSIIIAHRLSTIQDADLIVVLDKGEVVEQGNHNELISIDGVYKKLYDTQFKGLDI